MHKLITSHCRIAVTVKEAETVFVSAIYARFYSLEEVDRCLCIIQLPSKREN